MSIVEMYYYLFYKFYKLFDFFKTKGFPPESKAIVMVMSLNLWIILSIFFYYNIVSGKRGSLILFLLISLLIIIVGNWFIFWRKDKWRKYVTEFDQWPEEKNKQGTWIVAGLTLLLFTNLVFSLYMDPPPGGWN